jgi:hypothetical protein
MFFWEEIALARKNVNTTLDENLYKEIKLLAVKLDRGANDLIEEGMRYILEKYSQSDHSTEKKENLT